MTRCKRAQQQDSAGLSQRKKVHTRNLEKRTYGLSIHIQQTLRSDRKRVQRPTSDPSLRARIMSPKLDTHVRGCRQRVNASLGIGQTFPTIFNFRLLVASHPSAHAGVAPTTHHGLALHTALPAPPPASPPPVAPHTVSPAHDRRAPCIQPPATLRRIRAAARSRGVHEAEGDAAARRVPGAVTRQDGAAGGCGAGQGVWAEAVGGGPQAHGHQEVSEYDESRGHV